MSNPARHERQVMCDVFEQFGPDAPTLCEGWNARDLAAHLIVRETRPDAAVGILVKKAEPYSEKVRKNVASKEWSELIDSIRSGPPKVSPMRIGAVDRVANTLEFFVHVEDVRRAQPSWSPRDLAPDVHDQLLSMLKRGSKLLSRKSPCGLVLEVTSGAGAQARIVAKKGDPSVTVSGPVSEIVLFLYGRQAHANVELSGPDDLVTAVRNASFGV
jgi:uncharacterized protein (TIGR03085 family)